MARFPAAFDMVFAPAGIEVSHTPCRAPNADAYAQEWVRSVLEEYLEHLPILGARAPVVGARRVCGVLQPVAAAPSAMGDQSRSFHAVPVLGSLHHTCHSAA